MSAQRSPKFFYLILTLMIVVTSAFIAAVPAQAAGIGTWSSTGSMATARTTHSATLLPDGKVLVAGGVGGSGSDLSSALLFLSATILTDGTVLVACGYGGSYLSSAELYDPASGSWSSTGSMATGRAEHSATLLPGGKVLVAGGYANGSSILASAELYNARMQLFLPFITR
jgi:N-acetylneuraminic acid mutarotase